MTVLAGSVNPLDYATTTPPQRCAWVVFLLGSPSYIPGILVLHHSLKTHRSRYPLIVAVDTSIPKVAVDALSQAGLEVRVVKNLLPTGQVTTIAERFEHTWTKCCVFDFTEYDVCNLLLLVPRTSC